MIAVEVTCDQDGCEARATVRVDDLDVIVDTTRGSIFTLDTGWSDWPDGWVHDGPVDVCPAHADLAGTVDAE